MILAKQGQVIINVLPNDVLLHVFDCYMTEARRVESWHTLVHVCQRWRSLVFKSSRRLDLRISCTKNMRVREKLDVWPALPIVVSGICDSPSGLDDNIKAALAHNDCVYRIKLVSSWALKRVFATLEKPFPVLTDLELWSVNDYGPPVFPNPSEFLGGSSHLRSLELGGISIPGLPNLLLSLTDLVELRIDLTSESQFLSPEEIVLGVSVLTRLEVFALEFEYNTPRQGNSQQSPSLPHAVLPALTSFKFKGVIKYLEDLLALIDVPQLENLNVVFYSFNQLIFDTPQLTQLICRVSMSQAIVKAHMGFNDPEVWIEFSSAIPNNVLTLGILCIPAKPLFPCMAQFCHSPFFPLPTLETLYIGGGRYWEEDRRYHIDDSRWLEFLEPFTTVKDVYLSKEFALRVALALRRLVAGRSVEVLPRLRNIFVEELQSPGPVHKAIKKFVAARRGSVHTTAISDWAGIRQDVRQDVDDGLYVL